MWANSGATWASLAKVGLVALSISGSGTQALGGSSAGREVVESDDCPEIRDRVTISRHNGWTEGYFLGAIQDEMSSYKVINPVTRQIDIAFAFSEIDSDQVNVAIAAKQEAVDFVLGCGVSAIPSVVFSEEGAVSLEWVQVDCSVLVVFSGDGVGAFSVRRGQGFYSSKIIEFDLDRKMPDILLDMLNAL